MKNLPLQANRIGQIEQAHGFSPVWLRSSGEHRSCWRTASGKSSKRAASRPSRIVLWDTGACSANHGLGKNLLPSYDASNEHATLANTVKNVSGAKFQGSSAELATLDKLLAECAKIGEIVRQMYAVRMSHQAESADNVLACIVRARSVAIDVVSEASAKQRANALAEAQADMIFIKNQVMALSALFKALHLALPSVLASRVMPDTSTKGMERETTTLVSVGEIQKLKQQTELRSEPRARHGVLLRDDAQTVQVARQGEAGGQEARNS